MLVVAAVSGATDGFVDPSTTQTSVAAGGSVTVPETVHFDGRPQPVDVVIAFDATQSMSDNLPDAEIDAKAIVDGLTGPNFNSRFQIVGFQDSAQYADGNDTYQDYSVVRSFNGDGSADSAIDSIQTDDGGDPPESYFTVFDTVAKYDVWRPNAKKILVVIGDQTGHDPNQSQFDERCQNTDTQPDPNGGAAKTIGELKDAGVELDFLTYLGPDSPSSIVGCHTAMAAFTGGKNFSPGDGPNIAKQIGSELDGPSRISPSVAVVPTQPGNIDPSSWVTVSGVPDVLDVPVAGVDMPVSATIAPPATAPSGTYSVDLIARDGTTDRARETLTFTVGTPLSGLTLTVDQQTVPAGVKSVPFSAIPADRLALAAGDTTSSAPLGSTPLGSTPLGSTPLGSTPLGSTPLGSTGILDAPLGSTPLGSTPLQQVLLSQIVLKSTTWDAILCAPLAGKPLNALTLADVAGNPCSKTNFNNLKLADVDLSTSLLKGVRWTSLLLGDLPLGNFPVPDGSATWSDAITAAGGNGSSFNPATDSALGADIAGTLGSAPLGSTPLGSTPLGSTPLGSTQLSAVHVNDSKLASIALSSLNTAANVVNCAPASSVDCATATLGDAYAASAIKAGVTLADPALLPGYAAAGITLNDIVTSILAASDFPWEQLPVQGLQSVADTGQHATYHLTTTVDCKILTSFRATVTLPDGFFPVAGTSTISYGGGAPLPTSNPVPFVLRSSDNPPNAWVWGKLPCQSDFEGVESVQLSFQSYAGLTLGTHTSGASVAVGTVQLSVSNQAPITVTQNWESNDDPGSAPVIGPDTLLVGHIAASGDQDYYRLPLTGLPRGTKVSFYLSHIPAKADFDLVVGKDAQSFFSSPLGSTPLGSTPLEDTPLGFDNSKVALPSNTLQDVPLGSTPLGSTPLGSTSTNRGNADEAAGFVTQDETGYATIGISGYNGSSSSDAYVLRVKETLPPPVPTACQAAPFLFGSPSSFTPGALPSSLPSSTRTLFLVNRQRLSALYGAPAVNQLITALTTLSARTEVAGRIIPVDGSQAVRDAYAAWDANRCSVKAANDVVAAIQDVISNYRSNGLPNLKFIVLAGNQDALPSLRIHDPVDLSPENDFANDLAFTTSNLTQNNPAYAAAADNDILTDNAYAGWETHPWLDRSLLTPAVSTSRLLERPADMVGQINRYLGTNGISSPQTAAGTLSASSVLVTGYDFLADGATLVRANLNANFPGAVVTNAFGPRQAIGSDWSATDLKNSFLTSGTAPAIDAINGHYNQYELEAGDGSIASTADATNALFGRILFTMGCHGGYNLPNGNADPGTGKFLDWPELFGQKQAAALVANLGYGYGDTASVALSEKIMAIYAKNIRLYPTIGEAWAASLGDYASAAASAPTVYDEKVVAETTMYGLPFWRFTNSPTTGPAAASTPTTPDPLTGTPMSVATIAPGSLARTNFSDGTSQWSDGGNTMFGLYRPTQPLTAREVTAAQPARGLWVTALTTSDQTGVTPRLGYPTIDLSAHERSPNVQPIFFPSTPFSLTRTTSLGVRRDYANVTGQFRPDPATPGKGTERLVTSATMNVFYSNSDDTTPPLISLVNVSMSGSVATVSTRVTDDSGSVSQVAALVNDGSWRYLPLNQSPADPTFWSNTITVARDPEVVVEARDIANVGFSANKGSNFTSATSAPPPGPQIFIASPFGTYGQGQSVSAHFTCPAAVSCVGTVSDGSPIDTSTPGVHTFTVTATDADGNTSSLQRTYFVSDLSLVLRITPSTVTPPAIVLAFASLTNTAAVDRQVQINATFLVNTSFSWTSPWITVRVPAGRTYSGTIPFPILRAVPHGTYTVVLRARDVTGQVTATATLTVQ